MYYLQSRYYDPQIGRFINADAFPSTGQGIIGNNMFVYCGNNPVTRTDIGGYFWDTVLDVISLGVSIANVIENPDDPMAWLGVAADVASLVVPCVSGGGALVRAATKADDVVDAFKAADNVEDFSKLTRVKVEQYLPGQVKMDEAMDLWDDFLGPNQTNYNKFKGVYDPDRIFSADGNRSIRVANHEMSSFGTKNAHFHYEEWMYGPDSNCLIIFTQTQRIK